MIFVGLLVFSKQNKNAEYHRNSKVPYENKRKNTDVAQRKKEKDKTVDSTTKSSGSSVGSCEGSCVG